MRCGHAPRRRISFSLSSLILISCGVFLSNLKCISGEVNMFQLETDQFVGTDKSSTVFGSDDNEIFPVAYVDLNADKLTDLIAVSRNRTALSIYLAYNEAPYFRRAMDSQNVTDLNGNKRIVSVRPGDFTGDGVLDLMITLEMDSNQKRGVEVTFCSLQFGTGTGNVELTCPGPGLNGTLEHLVQEPMVLDLNGDMVLDLLGEKWIQQRTLANETVWAKQRRIWYAEKTPCHCAFNWKSELFIIDPNSDLIRDMIKVSSNAYADIDGDNIPELMIISESYDPQKGSAYYFMETFNIVRDLNFNGRITFRFKRPPEFLNLSTTMTTNESKVLGQPVIIDVDHDGKIEYLLPYCSDVKCSKSGIFLIEKGTAIPLPLEEFMYDDLEWNFVSPSASLHGSHFEMKTFYSRALVLRAGDYNLDGYPDLLALLMSAGSDNGKRLLTRAVMLENVACTPTKKSLCPVPRTFKANFDMFKDYQNVISVSFYDIKDNGALDVFIVQEHSGNGQGFAIRALENDMNFDSSFLKFIVLTGQGCDKCEGDISYGNILPGATVRYASLNSKGEEAFGIMVQAYRTSHVSLDLPCGIFGIGHSPNFIETFSVAIWNTFMGQTFQRTWHQIIPNSQIVVEPRPVERPTMWQMKLFLTPSDAVLNTFGVLVGICLVLGSLVGILELKERREDRKARQSEASRLFM